MPVYECVTTEGTLNQDQRERLAQGITTIHAEETGAPEPFIHVVFPELPKGHAYSSREVSTPSIIRGNIRAGRPEETRHTMLKRVFELWTEVTGAPAQTIVIAIMDFPSSWGMEAGMILPDPDPEAEQAWLEQLGAKA